MAQVKSGTLVASTVATVTLGGQVGKVRIANRDTTLEIFVSLNGATPTVGGDDFQLVGPGKEETFLAAGPLSSGNTIIKLISSGTPSYTVSAVDV